MSERKCRACGTWNEIVAHIVIEYPKLAQEEFKKWKQDQTVNVLDRKLCRKWVFVQMVQSVHQKNT